MKEPDTRAAVAGVRPDSRIALRRSIIDNLSTVPYALIVEDDALIMMSVVDIIEEAGFRSREATTGDDAKAVVDEHGGSITLLFTDVEKPGSTNGPQLARYVAAKFPDVAIVVCSGRVQPKKKDLPASAVFIAKPFGAQLVYTHLREILPDGNSPNRSSTWPDLVGNRSRSPKP
jgi:DNA-binding NtrC family response regulator